jgi:hypothetical protein
VHFVHRGCAYTTAECANVSWYHLACRLIYIQYTPLVRLAELGQQRMWGMVT